MARRIEPRRPLVLMLCVIAWRRPLHGLAVICRCWHLVPFTLDEARTLYVLRLAVIMGMGIEHIPRHDAVFVLVFVLLNGPYAFDAKEELRRLQTDVIGAAVVRQIDHTGQCARRLARSQVAHTLFEVRENFLFFEGFASGVVCEADGFPGFFTGYAVIGHCLAYFSYLARDSHLLGLG